MGARLSFEFFPPKTKKGRENLLQTAEQLNKRSPAFFSVTYGAGGSTRDGTFDAVQALRADGLNAVPHLSWGADRKDSVIELIERYQRMGVNRMVALRGDIPSGVGTSKNIHYAEELVRLIRTNFGHCFHLEVGAYPEVHPDSPSPEDDISYLKFKVDAGADSCITQYFYNSDSYFYFVDRCRASQINVPIVPGIMPITNYEGLVRFSNNCGAEIPRWIRLRLKDLKDDQASLQSFGIEVVTNLCQTLLQGGAPGLHFYTLNRAEPTEEIARNLSL
jgi:methylenetetrahydrofolate reductase (NADPH)